MAIGGDRLFTHIMHFSKEGWEAKEEEEKVRTGYKAEGQSRERPV